MSPRLPRITASELLRALRRSGWQVARQQGSHAQLTHPNRLGRVTIPTHAGETVKPFILSSVLDQAGLTADELRSLL
jgi:predicted RNA binding protein YcfA (HicA-like mRNA interferase family)